MRKLIALFPVVAFLPLAVHAAALPGNTTAGKKLHDAKCLSCHTDSVYQRKDRQIKDLEGLNQQIKACGHAAGITLEKSQADNLVKFLNETYYKF